MTTTPESSQPGERHASSVRRTTAVFLLCHGLRWLPVGFVIPIIVLVATERGLDLPTVGLVFAAYGVTTALLELPTGGLADAIAASPCCWWPRSPTPACCSRWRSGRRRGTPSPAPLSGGRPGAAPGPLESWYVDTVRAIDPAVPLRPGLSSAGLVGGRRAGRRRAAVGAAAGDRRRPAGRRAVSQLTLPVYGGLTAEVASFVAVLTLLHEPARSTRQDLATEFRAVPAVVTDGLALAAGTRDLRLLSGVS